MKSLKVMLDAVKGAREDINLGLSILDLRDEVRVLEQQIEALLDANEEFSNAHGIKDPASNLMWGVLRRNSRQIVNLRAALWPKQRMLERLIAAQ